MALSDRQIKATAAGEKPTKLADGQGLFLLINPNNSRYWRLKYRIAGKEKLLSLGVYPEPPVATGVVCPRLHHATNGFRAYSLASRWSGRYRRDVRVRTLSSQLGARNAAGRIGGLGYRAAARRCDRAPHSLRSTGAGVATIQCYGRGRSSCLSEPAAVAPGGSRLC